MELNKLKASSTPGEFAGKLLSSAVQAHVFHLSFKGETGSYAAHKALGEYYESIPGLVDSLVESYIGEFGLITNYKIEGVVKESPSECVKYFKDLLMYVQSARKQFNDSQLQNEIDNIVGLLRATLYKLQFLK